MLVVGDNRVIDTLSEDDGQEPLLMVQINTFGPLPKPVTPLVGLEGVVILPAPLSNVHKPVPTVGVFPAIVAVVPLTV